VNDTIGNSLYLVVHTAVRPLASYMPLSVPTVREPVNQFLNL